MKLHLSTPSEKLWRAGGYALCAFGVVFMLRDFLPVELIGLLASTNHHVYYRVVPGSSVNWYWWGGFVLTVIGIAVVIRSRKSR